MPTHQDRAVALARMVTPQAAPHPDGHPRAADAVRNVIAAWRTPDGRHRVHAACSHTGNPRPLLARVLEPIDILDYRHDPEYLTATLQAAHHHAQVLAHVALGTSP